MMPTEMSPATIIALVRAGGGSPVQNVSSRPQKIGDVLMEVETDKAAMEVEAQAEGYLADVRAREGENVPVGNVVAVIADEPGAVAAREDAKSADAPSDEQPPAPQDGNEVIMPALGMAQDAGLLVAWHKQPGDAVAADGARKRGAVARTRLAPGRRVGRLGTRAGRP